MKLDTEGAEFELFPHLIAQGVLCDLDFVASEFHFFRAPKSKTKEAWQAEKEMYYTLMNGISCQVKLTDFDDEKYYATNHTLPQ